MTIVGLGIDMIEVVRIERAMGRWGDSFVRRVYTPTEIARADRSVAGRSARLAARFAAKEAVMKALGIGWRQMSWREIEIVNDAQGRPSVRLHGAAKRVARERGIATVLVTVSHTHDHAVANAVALGEQFS